MMQQQHTRTTRFLLVLLISFSLHPSLIHGQGIRNNHQKTRRTRTRKTLQELQKKELRPQDVRPERLIFVDQPPLGVTGEFTGHNNFGGSLGFLPPLVDNSQLEDEDDPLVSVNIGINRIPEHFQNRKVVGEQESIFAASNRKPQDEEDITKDSLTQLLLSLSDKVEQVDQVVPVVKSGTVQMRRSALHELQAMDMVSYVEEDVAIYEDTASYAPGETIAASIDLANGDTYPNYPYRSQGPPQHTCSDPDAMKVAIIDGGLDVGHWDFAYCGIDIVTGEPLGGNQKVRCQGQEFLPTAAYNAGQRWYNSRRAHGSHVAGLVAASGMNGQGVTGMIADEDICLMFVRVFDDDGNAWMSQLRDGIIYAADAGAKVINMSLGTSKDRNTLRQAIEHAQSKNIILVGSAGNSGTNRSNYPAHYPSVISVAAVNTTHQYAYFSSHGLVDISAQGDQVLSIAPRQGETPLTVIENQEGPGLFEGSLMIHSSYMGRIGTKGILKNCGSGKFTCAGEGGHICLISKSGGGSFHSMAISCLLSNASAAIIYNDEDVPLLATLGNYSSGSPRTSPIPVIGVSESIGLDLIQKEGSLFHLFNPLETMEQQSDGSYRMVLTTGYERKTGTSMSAPQVSGAASVMWRQCPQCSNQEVTECLFSTAKAAGAFSQVGHGILQADLAFHCLVEKACCAGDFTPMPSSSVAPSHAPSLSTSPSARPSASVSPSRSPSVAPSFSPTMFPTVSPTHRPSHRPSSPPSLFPTFSPSQRPSYSPTQTQIPTRAPSQTPSFSPTQSQVPSAFPSSSPTTTCQLSCNNQYTFCLFRTSQLCDESQCDSLCQAAVDQGSLAPDTLSTCRNTWCPEEAAECHQSANCEHERNVCETAC